jgi:hypothetical protein
MVTNVSPNKLKPVLTNLVSGDYYLLPANLCGYTIAAAGPPTVTPVTNIVLDVSSTNLAGTNVAGTNVTATTNVQSFTVQEITWFTNYTYVVYPIECDGATTALRGGIDRIRLVRTDYDSLIGRTLIPITNYFSHLVTSNGAVYQQTFERVTTTPDILFSASIFGADYRRTAPTFTAGPAAPGGALAGPGTISGPLQIDFNKRGPSFNNTGPASINESDQSANGVWGYFDGSTNRPIVFPDTQSISNLEWMVLHPQSP